MNAQELDKFEEAITGVVKICHNICPRFKMAVNRPRPNIWEYDFCLDGVRSFLVIKAGDKKMHGTLRMRGEKMTGGKTELPTTEQVKNLLEKLKSRDL